MNEPEASCPERSELSVRLLASARDSLSRSIGDSFLATVEWLSDEHGHFAPCAVLTALQWTVEARADQQDQPAVTAVASWVEALLASIETETSADADEVRNAVAVCFVESLLPVDASVHAIIVGALGPRTIALVPPGRGSWLEPTV